MLEKDCCLSFSPPQTQHATILTMIRLKKNVNNKMREILYLQYFHNKY